MKKAPLWGAFRGERGSSLIRFKSMDSMLYKAIFYRLPTRVPTELEIFIVLIYINIYKCLF